MKTSNKELVDFIKEKIVRDANIDIHPQTMLFKERLIDSMNILILIGYVEQKLERRLTDDEVIMSHFDSVDTIVETFGI